MSNVMHATAALPLAGRYLTVVTVTDGEVHTFDALTVSASVDRVVLRIDTREYPAVREVLQTERKVTLFYGDHRGAWRVRGRVEASPGSADRDRFALTLSEVPTRGEQRDFIRTAMRIPVWCRVSTASNDADADAEARAQAPQIEGEGWEVQEVDVSAGGARLRVPGGAQAGRYVNLAFALPARPQPFVAAARVLRTLPSDVVDGHTTAALQYVGLSDAEQDELFEFIADALQGQFGGTDLD